jgi:ketosteroid isomerase-like protein
MSLENVEIARAFNRAFSAGDVDALLACCTPEVQLHSSLAVVGGGVYQGHDGARKWYRDIVTEWSDEVRSALETLYDLGDRVLVYTLLHGRGPHSGVEVAVPAAMLMRMEDRRIANFKGYGHREDALADLGVSEDELDPIAP